MCIFIKKLNQALSEGVSMLSTKYLTGLDPFKKVKIDVDLKLLDSCFDGIKPDPYAKGGYRYRALNRFVMTDKGLTPIGKEPLYQSSKVNLLWGNMDREFDELDFSGDSRRELEKLVVLFLNHCDVKNDTVEVGVHPIRTVANNKLVGHPAPEGAHSDGYMFTSIFVIRRDSGIDGAITGLYRDREMKGCLFLEQLNEGEGVLIDDKSIFHYTGPMKVESDQDLIRDILAITISPNASNPKEANAYSR